MLRPALFIVLFLFSYVLHASFIESSMGAAVVNDATAIYYNPAAISNLKNPQVILLNSKGSSHSQFIGQATLSPGNLIQHGNAHSELQYDLPSFYWAFATKNKLLGGIALIINDFNKDVEGQSLLRYAQSKNSTDAIDIVPALGYRVNQSFALGASLTRSRAHFLLEPISGIPSLNIPDSQSHNDSHGDAWAGDLGFIFKIKTKTAIGFNYRQPITYNMHGSSTFDGPPMIKSDDYHFKYWIPARSVLSASHWFTEKVGLIGTLQYVQWNIFNEGFIYNLATRNGIRPVVIQPYHYQNGWWYTAGANFRPSKKWVFRIAASYTESPTNGRFQIDPGDSLTIGGSAAYTIHKNIKIDAGYAHAFLKDQAIHTRTRQSSVDGKTHGFVNAVALKLTINV